MSKPFFTIVMCSYNRPTMVNVAIESVINQSFQKWELIIVNDASTDNTEEVIKGYLSDKRIKYIKNKENLGNYKSRKLAYDMAKGVYTTTLDDDDELPLNALELRYEGLELDNFPPLLHSNINFRYFYDGKWKIRPWFANPEVTYTDIWNNKQSNEFCQIVGATMTIRRDIFKMVGFWDYNKFPHNGADIEFALRLFKLGIKVAFCKESTLTYNLHDDQITKKTYGKESTNIVKEIKSLHSLEDEPHVYNKYFNKDGSSSKELYTDLPKKDGFLILNIHPKYDCAGAGVLLSNIINKFTKHTSYHIISEETFLKHDYHLKIGVDDDKIKELLEKADILHFNKYTWKDNKKIEYMEEFVKKKTTILHLHGNLNVWHPSDHPYNIFNFAKEFNLKFVSCNPLSEQLFNCEWLPNPLPTDKKEYMPTYKNWNDPLKIIHTVISDYNKGTTDIQTVMNYLQTESLLDFNYTTHNRSCNQKECLMDKRNKHVCIDNITQGFIGMAGWEALSQMLVCIARLDPYVEKRYKEVLSPDDELPIINVNGIDQMALEVVKLSTDVDYLYKKATYGRTWMEKCYHPQKIANLWSDYYEKIAGVKK